MAKEKTMKIGKYTMREKRISQLAVNEITHPRGSGRFKGTSVGRDKQGFFCMTHRCRSKSYPRAADIPKAKIAFIESTG